MAETASNGRVGILIQVEPGPGVLHILTGVIAAHSGEHAIYPDCREELMRAMGDAMRAGGTASCRNTTKPS